MVVGEESAAYEIQSMKVIYQESVRTRNDLIQERSEIWLRNRGLDEAEIVDLRQSAPVVPPLLPLPPLPLPNPLSEQEIAVLDCVAEGWSNAQIAAHLHVTQASVKTYMQRVFAKMELLGWHNRDRTGAVIFALRQRWITATSCTEDEQMPD